MHRDQPETFDNDAVPDCAFKFFLWVSRHYVLSRMDDTPLPVSVTDALDRPATRHMLAPLQTVWDSVFSSTHVKIQLHQPACPCLSAHEQALVTAIRCLQSSETEGGYEPSMLSVVPSITASALRAYVQQLSATLAAIERAKSVTVERSDGNVFHLKPAYSVH
ncbi:MAG: hypothetical protein AAF660_07950 [Pseudomonadota bacterium]